MRLDHRLVTFPKLNQALCILLCCACMLTGCKDDMSDPDPDPDPMTIDFPDEVTVMFENLRPEGIEYNKDKPTFLIGSLTMGDVYEVDFEGNFTNFTNDENLQASAGIQIDYERDRLLVTNFDPTAFAGGKSLAALNTYKLSTGEKINEVSLLGLVEDPDFVTPNDIAVDASGNVYITDFLGNVIYKVDENYEASLFSNSEMLVGPNGIDFHPDGYLVVSNLRAGQLLTISTDKPDEVSLVEIDDPLFSGIDGMVYKEDGNIVGITSFETLVELSSDDNWQSATILNSKALSTPGTTVAVTPEGNNYALLTDVANQAIFTEWVIEKVEF